MKRAAAALLLLAACAEPAGAESLQAVVDSALAHAPALRAAEAAREASDEDRVLGRAWLLPYLVADGALSRKTEDYRYDRLAQFLSTEVRNHERRYGLKAYQPLFDLEKWARYRKGEISAASGALRLARQRQRTMLETAAAWLNLMRTRAALAAAEAREAAMTRLAEQAGASFSAGTAAVNDSLAAASRRDQARASRIRAGRMVDQAKAELESLTGEAVADAVTPRRGIAPLRAEPDRLEAWQRRAEAAALGVRLGNKQVELARADHLQAIGGALPKVQIVAGWNRTRSSDGAFGGSEVKGASIGVELAMPLYAGGATWAKQRKSEHEKTAAEFRLAEARRKARLAARRAFLDLGATAAEIKALEAALASAESDRKAAEAGLAVGLRTVTEALDAEERLAAARERYADAVARHAMAYLRLMAAADRLDGAAIARVDALLAGGGGS